MEPLERRPEAGMERREEGAGAVGAGEPGRLWPIGSASAFAVVLLLDLMALDDITTAGAWMPEILFLFASIPALITTGHYTFRKRESPGPPRLEETDEDPALSP